MKLDAKSLSAGLGFALAIGAMLIPFGTCASRSELQAHAVEEKKDREAAVSNLDAKLDQIIQILLTGTR